MVGSSACNMEWQNNPIRNPRPCSGLGCIPSGMGCSFRRSTYRRSLVREGTHTAHQLLGVDGRCTGSENICKAQKEHSCGTANRQQNGNLLCKPHGGNPSTEPGAASLSAVAVVPPEEDNSAEYLPGTNNGIADKESQTMQSLAEWMLNVQVFKYIMHGDGPMPNQPVCSTSQSSVRPLCELVARSICHSNRCIPDYLEGLSGVRISTLWPSWQVSSIN